MIKLIATDMDGTLLDEKGKLPKNFFNTLEKLNEKGVKFVVASGRPYPTLFENFKPISEDLYYICDNGAFIVENGTVSDISIINKDTVHSIIKYCADIPNIQIILCGMEGAYHLPCSSDFTDEIDKYYIKKHIVNNLLYVSDDIFKITICDLSNPSTNSYKHLEPIYGDDLMVVVSGEVWVDIMNKDVNKGAALEKIQKDQNISKEETMVFGDFYNDVEMLKKAHYSFVMENANEDMKQYGNFIAKSNKEYGVIKAIEEYVLND
ncbi:HAD family hydrolase [Clostridium sp. LP20]|uniref:HAD family hydrolase n=1 Tax=Clostridium sp. LP20 TaxID=3418665 RepID=UPI003EE489D8